MSVLYIILPLALLVAGGAVLAFTWVVRSGQLDDVDTPPRRILFDDDDVAIAQILRPTLPTPQHLRGTAAAPAKTPGTVLAE